MRYLVDTDICIYIANRKPAGVLARLERLRPGDVGMSVVTYLELVYGAYKSQQAEANMTQIKQLSHLIPVQPIDGSAATHYGRLRAGLEGSGPLIGAYDLLIAAHALALELTLVTNNVREFRRVPGLRLENWAD